MIHKVSIAGILAVIAYIVYTSLYKGYILWPLLVLMAFLAAVYYVTTSLVTYGMVKKMISDDDPDFIIRSGYIEKNGKDLTSGVLVVSRGRICMFARKGDLGGCRPVFEAAVDEVESYSIGKVDDYHMGLSIDLKKKAGPYRFTGRKFAGREAEFRNALGWGEEPDT